MGNLITLKRLSKIFSQEKIAVIIKMSIYQDRTFSCVWNGEKLIFTSDK